MTDDDVPAYDPDDPDGDRAEFLEDPAHVDIEDLDDDEPA
jgi:hypothetical protein